MLLHVLVSLVVGCGCMETRETVERTVMVRTTGSDLHPAATGYIYKKDDDGPESVVEMGASEVLEQLSKLYTRPVYASSEKRVIPVKEDQEAHVDGIADVDYKKIFDDYSSNYGDGHAYDDYLKSLKRFKGGLYHKYDGDSKEDGKGSKNHHYGKGDAGGYHNAKFESYSISGGHKKSHDDGDAHEKHHDRHESSKEGGKSAANNKDYTRGFQSVYDDGDHKDDHDYFGKGGKAFADGYKSYGTGDRRHEYHHYEPKHLEAKVGSDESQGKRVSAVELGAKHSSEERATSDETHGDVRPQEGQAGARSYGYEVKH